MDCPAGADIPGIIVQYNHYLYSKSKVNFGNQYRTLKKSEQAHNCTGCGACVKLCPQKIDIPRYMKEAAALAATLL
jgi:predicted aldo/keto reductase-like oxidoreductase